MNFCISKIIPLYTKIIIYRRVYSLEEIFAATAKGGRASEDRRDEKSPSLFSIIQLARIKSVSQSSRISVLINARAGDAFLERDRG